MTLLNLAWNLSADGETNAKKIFRKTVILGDKKGLLKDVLELSARSSFQGEPRTC